MGETSPRLLVIRVVVSLRFVAVRASGLMPFFRIWRHLLDSNMAEMPLRQSLNASILVASVVNSYSMTIRF